MLEGHHMCSKEFNFMRKCVNHSKPSKLFPFCRKPNSKDIQSFFLLIAEEVNFKRLRKRCCQNTWFSTLFTYQ